MENGTKQRGWFVWDRSAPPVPPRETLSVSYLLGCLSLLFLIFIIDLMIPLGVACGVLYVLLITSTLRSPRWELILGMAIAATVLTLVGFALSPGGSTLALVITNRALSLLAIWVTAFICLKQKKNETNLTWAASKLATIQERQRQELSHKAILENVVDAIITITSHGIILAFNAAGERIFGYTADEVIGKNIKMLMPSPFREEHDDYLARYRTTGEKHIIGSGREVVGQHKDGTTFPIHLSVSLIFVEEKGQDQEILFTGIVRDLTEQKQKEADAVQRTRELQIATEKSRANERRIEAIVNTAVDPIITISGMGLIKSFNPAAERLFGYSATEISDQNIKLLMPSPYREEHDGYLARYLATGKQNVIGSGREVIGQRKDGTTFPLHLSVSQVVVVDEDRDQELLFTGIIRDLTEQKQKEAEAEQRTLELQIATQKSKANERQAELANQSKSEFLANMSHEIRTPMTAILGFTDILLGSVVDPDDVESVRTIKRNGESLIGLINDILDLSKIEAGKLDVEQINCSARQVVADVSSLMRVRAKAKGLLLDVRFDGPVPETICSDPTRLRQVLINLVGNAIKFTETGSIQIVTRLMDEAGEEPKLKFDVIDNGIGIPEDRIDKLFLAFTQADGSTTRQYGGTGLGLTISKRLVELLGGNISVSSTVGKGSTFSVTIATGPLDNVPLIQNAAESVIEGAEVEEISESELQLRNCRILFAEDGPDNQRLISFILKKAGADVTVADNGQIAVDLATAALSENCPFDVILMDMQMPVLDGYAATRRLRKLGCSRPIIALTAHAMSTDRQKCHDAGCDDYATKPIDRKKLIEMIAGYVKQVGEATPV